MCKCEISWKQIGNGYDLVPNYIYKPCMDPNHGHFLGKGAYAEVFRGYNLLDNYKPVAIKRLSTDPNSKRCVKQKDIDIEKKGWILLAEKIKAHEDKKHLLKIFDVC